MNIYMIHAVCVCCGGVCGISGIDTWLHVSNVTDNLLFCDIFTKAVIHFVIFHFANRNSYVILYLVPVDSSLETTGKTDGEKGVDFRAIDDAFK